MTCVCAKKLKALHVSHIFMRLSNFVFRFQKAQGKMNTKMKVVLISFISLVALMGCLSLTTTEMPAEPPTEMSIATSIPAGQIETGVAATIFANETLTATAELSPYIVARTAAAMTAEARPTPSMKKFYVNVPADGCWMNSNLNVLTGQKVTISASGIVNTHGGNPDSNNEPDGQKYICGAIQCPKQGVGYGALIGRLDDLETFFVGTHYEFVATKDGQLHFTVNDWECDDNSGSFSLVITIQ